MTHEHGRSLLLAPGALLEVLFERGDLPMALLIENDEILLANSAFAHLLGYEPLELAGKRFETLQEPPGVSPGAETLLRSKTGQSITTRVRISRASDPDSGICGLVVVEDTRLSPEVEAQHQKLEARVRKAQKMEAVGQLTGGIAHDFNNMLTVILANAELIAGALGHDEGARADLDELRAAARRGTVMVRKLLGFSRRERLVLQPVNLGHLVQELTKHLQHLMPPSIRFELSGERTPDIQADPNAVEQILMNLLTNARDAMEQGGVLTIRTDLARLDADGGNYWEVPGEYVRLTVQDTGTGMDETTRGRLFEPFFTTKAPGLGTGLGMAMIYGLVKQHTGFITVESEPGVGTTVRIYFPKAQETAARAVAAEEPVMQGGNETILLVEDEEPIRRTARRILERFGYRVLVAADGMEGLDAIRTHGGKIHLVVSDVAMPRLGGRGLYDAARAAGARMKFLFASGYTARDVNATGDIDPALPFIHKPWTMDEFLKRVRDVLDSAT